MNVVARAQLIFQMLTLLQKYILGGPYLHSNGDTLHFVYYLETKLQKNGDKDVVIHTGDMNIDLIRFENNDTCISITSTLHCDIHTSMLTWIRYDIGATCHGYKDML